MDNLTIPAHIENGTISIDAPVPSNALSVEVRVQIPSKTDRRSVAAYLEAMPPGMRSEKDIAQELREEREGWPD